MSGSQRDATPDGAIRAIDECMKLTRVSSDELLSALLRMCRKTLEGCHYAELEHEHLGCHVAKTGIYAASNKGPSFEVLDLSKPSETAPATQDGPLGGWAPVGPAAIQLDFLLTQFQIELQTAADDATSVEDSCYHDAEALKIKRQIIDLFAPSAIAPTAWIPVTERLPEGDGDVLVAHPCYSNQATQMFGVTTRNASTVRKWMSDKSDNSMHPAFWMPMPKGPA